MSDPQIDCMLRKHKGFTKAVKLMLKQEYKFMDGEKIQDMCVQDLLKEFDRHLRDGWKLDAGQTVWWAAHKDKTPGRNKTIEKTRMVPVILTIASQDDRKLRLDLYSASEIRKSMVAHMSHKAYKQEGVLNQADNSQLISVSTCTFGKAIHEYQIEQIEVLRYHNTINDIVLILSHKWIIIQQYLHNIPLPEITKLTFHREKACDRYIKTYMKVRNLYDGMPAESISTELEMSNSLVHEDIMIIEKDKQKFEVRPEKLINYLGPMESICYHLFAREDSIFNYNMS